MEHAEDKRSASRFYTVQEIRERLSISTLVFRGYRSICEASLTELVENGIRRIELIESPEQYDLTDSGSMKHVARICRNTGIEIVAYHAYKTDFAGIDGEALSEEERLERVDVCRRQISTMLELDGTVWGCHARNTDDGTVRKSYEELVRHVEGTEAVITVENFARQGTFVEERVAFLDEIDHPQIGMILDIGHVQTADGKGVLTRPGGPTEIIGLCGHRLKHVHLHGFKDSDHYPPLCEGDVIQWVELFRELKASNYPGAINFEPAGEPRRTGSVEATGRFPEHIVEMAELQT